MLERRGSGRAPNRASSGTLSPAVLPVLAGQDEPDPTDPAPGPAGPLLDYARKIAADHQATHGQPITRDALRARLGVSNQLASDILRHVRTTHASPERHQL